MPDYLAEKDRAICEVRGSIHPLCTQPAAPDSQFVGRFNWDGARMPAH